MGAFSDLRLSIRRAVLLTALLAASVFATGAGAQATTVTHIPFSATFTNLCTGETFVANGFQHFAIYADNGLFHLEINLQDMKGTELLTGARYVVKEQTSVLVNDIPPGMVQNTESITHMIRQKEEDGTLTLVDGDDFKVKTRMQFVLNANGVPTVNNFEVTTDNCQ